MPSAFSTCPFVKPRMADAATVAENVPRSTGSIHSSPPFSSGFETANPSRHITSFPRETALIRSLPEALANSPTVRAAGTTEAEGWTKASSWASS